uniref:Uncharacterized protein n=1 Tax=Mammarenavirus choriomeningitidis TaxID=3052303 RepID=A0A059U4P2_9VIRU|nr:hypothetical protein KUE_IGS310001 [Mammarenavirus choriomeningitidis]
MSSATDPPSQSSQDLPLSLNLPPTVSYIKVLLDLLKQSLQSLKANQSGKSDSGISRIDLSIHSSWRITLISEPNKCSPVLNRCRKRFPRTSLIFS